MLAIVDVRHFIKSHFRKDVDISHKAEEHREKVPINACFGISLEEIEGQVEIIQFQGRFQPHLQHTIHWGVFHADSVTDYLLISIGLSVV